MERKFILESKRWASCILHGLQDLHANHSGLLDVQLVDKNGEQTVLAHSLVLAAASPALKSILVNVQQKDMKRISFSDINVSQWKLVVEFLYHGKMSASLQEIAGLQPIAHMLQISELDMLCGALVEKVSDLKNTQESRKQTTNDSKLGLSVVSESAVQLKSAQILDELESGESDGKEQACAISNERKGGMNDIHSSKADKTVEKIQHCEHSYSKSGEKVEYECTKCNVTFDYGHSLFAHDQSHRKNIVVNNEPADDLTCSQCGKQCKSKKSLAAHERSHRTLPFKCKFCSAAFHFQVTLDNHLLKKHKEESDFPKGEVMECSYCDKHFQTSSQLKQHLSKAHKSQKTSEELTQCDQCNREVSNLERHKRKYHPPEKEFRCDICGKIVKHSRSLADHMNIHTKETPYACVKCGARFKHASSLYNHKKTHMRTKPRKFENDSLIHLDSARACKVCGKFYSTTQRLRSHMKTHTASKFVGCKECGKVFTKRNAYRMHLLTHQVGQGAHKCDYCNKTFHRKYDWQIHLRHHTREKPFDCFLCGAQFSCLSNLYAHGRKIHGSDFKEKYKAYKEEQVQDELEDKPKLLIGKTVIEMEGVESLHGHGEIENDNVVFDDQPLEDVQTLDIVVLPELHSTSEVISCDMSTDVVIDSSE